MAGQNPSRREVLEAISLAAFAGLSPGFSRWAFAHTPDERKAPRPPLYVPVFFTPPQYATVERLCDMIIPALGVKAPGAKAAGVSEFIDFMVANDPSLQTPFRSGLVEIDRLSYTEQKQPFISLSQASQQSLLERLAYHKKFVHGEERAQSFFLLLRKYCVTGFYTSEIGFKALDSPSLRFYAESPGCPHPDDPEHLHIQSKG